MGFGGGMRGLGTGRRGRFGLRPASVGLQRVQDGGFARWE